PRRHRGARGAPRPARPDAGVRPGRGRATLERARQGLRAAAHRRDVRAARHARDGRGARAARRPTDVPIARARAAPRRSGAGVVRPAAMTITLHVSDARGYRVTADLGELEAMLRTEGATVWIDSDERSATCDDLLGSRLKLHPLVIEDIYSDRVTPKIE